MSRRTAFLSLLVALVPLAGPLAVGPCAASRRSLAQGVLPATGRIQALALSGRFSDHLFDPELPGNLTHLHLEISQG